MRLKNSTTVYSVPIQKICLTVQLKPAGTNVI